MTLILQNGDPYHYCVQTIITKALTNRFLPTLDEIISIEQSAAVPNRTIYNNLFTIRDIIEYSNKKKLPTYILSFDQEKAFDKVHRDYMFKCLEKMNYPKQYYNFLKSFTRKHIRKYKTMDTSLSALIWKGE